MAKVIILIGKTGSGKSTLANVISGTRKFKESSSSASVTKDIQVEEFVEDDIKYEVIDTVGIGDTQLKREEVLDKIAEAVYLARNGISKVLFVTNGRFDQFEMSIYALLSTIIFDKNVTNYTTIIRTKFPEFEDEEERQKDIEKMVSSEGELSNIIKSCQQRVVHVDNPSLDVDVADDESDGEREEREELINLRKKIRSKSRRKLLEHLQKKCLCTEQEKEYKPEKLQQLNAEIIAYMEKKIESKRKLEEKLKKLEEKEKTEIIISNQARLNVKTIENSESKKKSILLEDNLLENNGKIGLLTTEIGNNQYLQDDKSESEETIIEITKLKIVVLKSKVEELRNLKELKEEIQKIDGFIRQKVFRHIFNNLDDIAKIVGGGIFINSIIGNNNLSSDINVTLSKLQEQKEKLEEELLKQEDKDKSLEEITSEINKKEQKLFELKKQLLDIKKIVEKWLNNGFSIQQVKEWIEIGFDVDEYGEVQKWKEHRFTSVQTKEWVKAGAKLDDHEFVGWFRDTKKETPQWITNYKEDYQVLRQRFRECGLCSECQQPKNTKHWCRSCNSSGSAEVDDFIEKYQQKASEYKGIVEWISYEKFTQIEYLAEGGFGKIYKAKWNNQDNKKKLVALKSLNNSADIKEDFLQEIANHKIFISVRIVKCFGISQDPATKNYLMVMDYIKDGDLRRFLKDNQLSFQEKLNQLWRMADGLKQIHKQGLTHRDFHAGNILNRSDKKDKKRDAHCFITDLGLCRPANEVKREKVYGVLPYVAPEVLTGQPYTEASDVYSWGIVAIQTLTGLPPYHDVAHDESLATRICQGLRPQFQIKIPQLLEDLIKRCWEADPAKRPTAEELYRVLHSWLIKNEEKSEFAQQVQETEEFNRNLPASVINPQYTIHPSAIYTSRLLDFKGLPKPQNSEEINKLFYNSSLNTTSLLGSLESNWKNVSAKHNNSDSANELEINSTQTRTKRQLSLSSQNEPLLQSKSTKLTELLEKMEIDKNREYYSESMELDYTLNWINIHPSFTPQLIQLWQSHHFTHQQIQDWINIGLQPTDYKFCAWLRDVKKVDAEWVLNYSSEQELRQGYQDYQQLQSYQELPPKNN